MRKEQTPVCGFNGFESADYPSDCVMSKISLAHDGHAWELGTWHRPYALKPSIEKPPARAVDHLLDRQGAARLSFLSPMVSLLPVAAMSLSCCRLSGWFPISVSCIYTIA